MRTLKRQGDVLLERVADELGTEIKLLGNEHPRLREGVIAEGEVTGHAHRLVGEGALKRTNLGTVAIVYGGAEVVHEEHDKIELEPGIWLVHRQTEYAGAGEQIGVYD